MPLLKMDEDKAMIGSQPLSQPEAEEQDEKTDRKWKGVQRRQLVQKVLDLNKQMVLSPKYKRIVIQKKVQPCDITSTTNISTQRRSVERAKSSGRSRTNLQNTRKNLASGERTTPSKQAKCSNDLNLDL
jgi:hypothetical protein